MPSLRQASTSASIHSARTRQRAASWTSTQSLRFRAEAGELGQAAGDGRGARRAAAAREREPRVDRQSRRGLVVRILGRDDDQDPAQPRHRDERGQRVGDERPAGDLDVLLGQSRPRRGRRCRRTGRARTGGGGWKAKSASGGNRSRRAKDKPQVRAGASRHLKSLLCFRAARDFLPPSCFSPTSPPASASRCPARPARPTHCCSPASPRRNAPEGRCSRSSRAEPADAQRLADEIPFFAPGLRVALFPDWETLPYDTFSPHEDLISERLATLWRIRKGDVDVVLMPATTALVRLAPPGFIAGYTFHFTTKQRLDEAALKAQLTLAGYTPREPGRLAGRVRGARRPDRPVPDGLGVPYRVDLFGDEIDSIRTFDPDTQRSLYPVPDVRLLPGREFPMDEPARNAFRARWRERFEGDPTKVRIYKDIGAGIATAGIEYYLPLFFDATATVFDYLGGAATVALHGEVDEALQRFWTDTRERHRFFQHDRERPILAPEALFLKPEEFFAACGEQAQLTLALARRRRRRPGPAPCPT